MNELTRLLQRENRREIASRPKIFDLRRESHRSALKALLKTKRIAHVVDDYEEQLREFFAIEHPAKSFSPFFEADFRAYLRVLDARSPRWQQGRWVYYPWLVTVVHILHDTHFQRVRTARNRNLITEEEQQKYYGSTIGIAGLSVGNSVALAITLQGGGRRLRLADHDRFTLSNLNRVRGGTHDLGVKKVEMTARQIYALNPYAHIELFGSGLTPKNIDRFFAGPPILDVVIDEIDNLAVKCLIRERCRKYRIPVVMAADNGDNGVIDIERYDQNPNTPFFHGRIPNASYERLRSLNKIETGRLIGKHIGFENVPQRMIDSLAEVGKTLVSWPQLGGAALLNGSAVAYCVRRILNGQPLESNRALISLDEKLMPVRARGERRRRRSSTK